MRMLDHVPMRAARTLAGALHFAGLDVGKLYAECGVELAQLFDRTAQIPYARWCALWRRAEVESRDPLLGVRAGGGVDLSFFAGVVPETDHTLVHLCSASATVGESLERYAHYFAIGFGAPSVALHREGGKLALVYTAPSPEEPTSLADSVMGLVVNYLRTLAAKPIQLAVELADRRAGADAYRKFLQVPVTTGNPRNAVIVPARAASMPMRSAKPADVPRLLARAEQELAARALPRGFLAEVRTVIAAQIEQGGADTVAAVADALQTSRRTLARKLAAERTSYQALLDDVRTEIATRDLAAGAPITRVAQRLGFADASSFTRAFRRWTGETPATRRGTSRTP